MITTGDAEPAVDLRATRPAAARRGWAAVWAARGWWGGLLAAGLAWRGQDLFLNGADPELAGRFYWAAGILLIAVLFHPRLPRRAALDGREAPAGARNGAPAGGAP